MPGTGELRPGRCWYCGRQTLRKDDPEEHVVPAAIGGTLVTHKVYFECNQRASRELDQPFLREWQIALARNELMIPDRRGKRPPAPEQDAEPSGGNGWQSGANVQPQKPSLAGVG